MEASNLYPLVHRDHVYMQIERGIYGLPQAGILANKLLQKKAPHGYFETKHTP